MGKQKTFKESLNEYVQAHVRKHQGVPQNGDDDILSNPPKNKSANKTAAESKPVSHERLAVETLRNDNEYMAAARAIHGGNEAMIMRHVIKKSGTYKQRVEEIKNETVSRANEVNMLTSEVQAGQKQLAEWNKNKPTDKAKIIEWAKGRKPIFEKIRVAHNKLKEINKTKLF